MRSRTDNWPAPQLSRRELLGWGLAGSVRNRWCECDPEDTVRFHALQLREAGMIKTSPHKVIAQGIDWRFLNELKKELKG